MTASQRIQWAKGLTIAQLALHVVVMLSAMTVGIAFFREGTLVESMHMSTYMAPVAMVTFLGFFGIAFPFIVLYGLQQRTQIWGIAVYVLLAYQVVAGGGIFSILPLIAIIFLLDRAVFEELTGGTRVIS